MKSWKGMIKAMRGNEGGDRKKREQRRYCRQEIMHNHQGVRKIMIGCVKSAICRSFLISKKYCPGLPRLGEGLYASVIHTDCSGFLFQH